jgi:hypothetical protein
MHVTGWSFNQWKIVEYPRNKNDIVYSLNLNAMENIYWWMNL